MLAIQHLTDADLIQDFRNGQDHALEEILNRYKDRLYTAIVMLVKDRNLAEDLFQDAFLKMIRTIRDGGYAEQGKFLPWAMRIAHNLCMDHFRRVKQHIPITLPDGRDLCELLPLADSSTPEQAYIRRQSHESIRSLISLLPDEQREVVIMRIYSDLSFKEIAQLTNVSINTALGRMRYALINLRRLMEEQEIVLR